MKKELNEITNQNKVKSVEIKQAKENYSTYHKQRSSRKICESII